MNKKAAVSIIETMARGTTLIRQEGAS